MIRRCYMITRIIMFIDELKVRMLTLIFKVINALLNVYYMLTGKL